MGLLQYKWFKDDNNFEKTKINDLYGLEIPDIFMNIMSCHGFYKSPISTVILSLLSYLVPYYISKFVFVAET